MESIYLKDYRPPDFFILTADLTFDIYEFRTTITTRLNIKRNGKHARSLHLQGEKLKLLAIKLDDKNLQAKDYQLTDDELIINNVGDEFIITTEVLIKPYLNTELSGLYKSKDIYCTQCEAQGFRRITFFIDRPDNLTQFTTTIIANKKYPTLLSNGNLVASGSINDKCHYAKWRDPFPKPSYLFALVVGDLECLSDRFITVSGKNVALKIYAKQGNKNKCKFAMQSLKKAFKWDEENFGREYDLAIYQIVVIDDFNAGAMENKGLNIFNNKFILVDDKTATDEDYYNVATIVAHEYFHNWTGNKLICRDWFQITLKEGLTTFREQLFAESLVGKAVIRIKDVNVIRSKQFSEAAGPMAHAIQPQSYIAVDNFYTTTVYEKGAEVIRMLHTILGEKLFRQGLDLYFERFDGKTVTIEDFIKVLEDASNIDLQQFRLWYSQVQTPILKVTTNYNKSKQTFTLRIKQNAANIKNYKNLHIPVKFALYAQDGSEIISEILHVRKASEKFVFSCGASKKPIPSLLQDFSAPVKLNYDYSDEELVFLAKYDRDPFNKWNAGQLFATKIIIALIKKHQGANLNSIKFPDNFAKIFADILDAEDLELTFKALLLTLPTQAYLMELMDVIDVEIITKVYEFTKKSLAASLANKFLHNYNILPNSSGARALRNICLEYLLCLDANNYIKLALEQYHNATNMTDIIGALKPLANINHDQAIAALEDFYHRWQDEELVVNKWLELQALSKLPKTLQNIQAIINSKRFDIKNPNKVYALIRTFCTNNHINFHAKNGAGYEFLTTQVLVLDKINPQVAARIVTPLIYWRRFTNPNQQLMRKQLQKIHATMNISKNLYEIVHKGLQA